MEAIHIPANNDFEAFLAGQKIADHPKKRAMSMILAIVAGLLLYSGLKTQPMDEQLTYAGGLTLVYIFFGRNLMFNMKIKNLWKQRRESNPELVISSQGVEVKHHIQEQCKILSWDDFGFYKCEDNHAFLYPKEKPENWLTLSFVSKGKEEIEVVKSLIKENIKISENK